MLTAHVGGPVLAPLQLLPAAIAALLNARRARPLARDGRHPIPAWRQWCFYGGLALMVGTLASPIAHISDELFLAHMTEHLLLADFGALLLVLGLTAPLLAPILKRAGWLRVLGNPVVALPLWAIDLYAWHAPALYQGAVEHPALHALEHASFVALGMAMWMPLFGPLPQPAWFGNVAKLVYIIAVRLIGAVLGNVLVWSGTILYPRYAAGERSWHVTAVQDQNVAGAIMMVEGSLLTIVLFGWLFAKAAREGEQRQELLDFAAEHGVALDEKRAARAVSAGRGDELRRRLIETGG